MKLSDVLLDDIFSPYHVYSIVSSLVTLLLSLILFTSCTRKPEPPPPPPPPTVADLHFPVLVLFPNAYTVLFKDATDLHTMITGVVIALDQPPLLIDSRFNIRTLDYLKTIHGGLWLMMHPVGVTEVTFTLARAPKSGIDAAREAIRTQLDQLTLPADLEKTHAALAGQTTLKGMFNLFPKDEITPPP